MHLDEIDSKVIQYLMAQGRMTWAELAGALDLCAPATADRVRRLEV
ncbi:MAG: AsnC family protein [Leptolyngbyaceae cyanobacterium CSU_1_4]|nr:AsnC family protein [Leptolyngbyaceae cyanobacterium CSU_1_4]